MPPVIRSLFRFLFLSALAPLLSAQLTFDPANPPESVLPPTEQYNHFNSWQKGAKTLMVMPVHHNSWYAPSNEDHTLYAQWAEVIPGETVYLETFPLPTGQSNLATNYGAPGRPNWIWTHGPDAEIPVSYAQDGGPMIGSAGALVITGANSNWTRQPYFLYDNNPPLDLSLGAIEPVNIRQFRFVATRGTANFQAYARAALRFGTQWLVSEPLEITGTETNAFQAFTLNIQAMDWYPAAFIPGESFSIAASGGLLADLSVSGQLNGLGLVAETSGSPPASGSQWRVDDVEISATPSTTTPRVYEAPQAQFAPWGDQVSFSVQAGGEGVLSYQWYKDGAPIPGATGPTLTLNPITQDDAGLYHVVVSMNTGFIVTPAVPLEVVQVAVRDRLATAPETGLTPDWVHAPRFSFVPTRVEWAMGFDTAPETRPMPGWFVPNGGGFHFRYFRRHPQGPLRPQVELSTDLIDWYPLGVEGETPVGDPVDGQQAVEIDVGDDPVLFARLSLIDERLLEELSFEATRDLWLRMMHFYSGVLNPTRTRGMSGGFNNDMELVARTLWTLGAWFYHDGRPATMQIDGNTVDLQALVVDALRHGTDGDSTGFWGGGGTGKSNQNIVEAANIAFVAWALGDAHHRGVSPAPWSQLSSTDRANIHAWLDSNDNNVTGTQQYFDNNWNMFIALNYESRRQLYAMGNSEFDTWVEPAIDEALRLIQTFNRGGGWFTDDNQGRPEYDDYGPWTIVSHQLFYFMMNPERVADNTPIAGSGGITPRQILREISDFLGSQAYMYDSEGGHPEWGRSTTYKFGRLISNILAYVIDQQFNTPDGWDLPFTIMPEGMSAGQLKRMVRLHLNHYLREEMIDPVSFRLHPGQTRNSGQEVIESYSIPGSTYWAMITFAGLWLIENDDPFWTLPEDPLPSEQGDFAHWFRVPGLLMHHHRDTGHVEAINLGNSKQNRLSGQYDRKYEKFVYSSRIGFVTRSGPAFDQAIEVAGETRAAPPRADLYFYEGMDPADIGVGRSVYTLAGRTVSTLIFLKDGAMVRVHRMSGDAATVREGGYALGHNTGDPLYSAWEDNWQYYESPHGSAFTQLLYGYDTAHEVTNTGPHHTRHEHFRLFHGETQNAPGGTVFAILSRGSRGPQDYEFWKDFVTDITVNGDEVTVEFHDGTVKTAPFRAWEE